MTRQDSSFSDEEPLSFDPEIQDSPPVPLKEVPPRQDALEAISLVDDSEVSEHSVKAFGSGARAVQKIAYKRQLNADGTGATRCRLFKAKLAPQPLEYLEKQVNDWLDNESIEVKHVGHVIGTIEGKMPEPTMIVMVWF